MNGVDVSARVNVVQEIIGYQLPLQRPVCQPSPHRLATSQLLRLAIAHADNTPI